MSLMLIYLFVLVLVSSFTECFSFKMSSFDSFSFMLYFDWVILFLLLLCINSYYFFCFPWDDFLILFVVFYWLTLFFSLIPFILFDNFRSLFLGLKSSNVLIGAFIILLVLYSFYFPSYIFEVLTFHCVFLVAFFGSFNIGSIECFGLINRSQ